MAKELTYISLFSGSGVGCYGFKQQNFNCIATNEILEKRLNIQKYNNVCKFSSGYIAGDIKKKEVKEKIFQEVDRWKKYNKEVDIVIATPPCQGMSIANHKKKNEKARNSLVVESIKLTKQINPKFFIFENVQAFLNTTCTDVDKKDKTIKEAIQTNLEGYYNILYKVINFKDYGSNSSRTRTLVVGTRKDIGEITPYDIFPSKKSGKTLRAAIGNLPKLNQMGKISKEDIYHNYRHYNKYMFEWIKDLKEGQSAFENDKIENRPHQIINGIRVLNKNKNGDKYTRCRWDSIAPCVHTRNDILASQSTIHPSDNRVFSIRELMKLMTIPDTFRWTDVNIEKLNSLNISDKKKFLSSAEINIRQSIGEAVPTIIFSGIAKTIKLKLNEQLLDIKNTKLLIEENNLTEKDNLKQFIKENINKLTLPELFKISELANSERTSRSAFYTNQNICFSLIKELPDFIGKKNIRILEPSVGVGNFLPLIIKKYEYINSVEIDVIDIDKNALEILKLLLKKMKISKTFKLNFINSDFLLMNLNKKYDVVVGNPPFGKVINNKPLLKKYRYYAFNKKTNNICAFFIEKATQIGNYIALISPKSLLSGPEFNGSRAYLSNYFFKTIIDYGEKGFRGVKIETISFVLGSKPFNATNEIKVESYITNKVYFKRKQYILSKKFPTWLIYRNSFFDKISDRLKFNIFNVFRDRKITKKHTKSEGEIRVLKSRNIDNNKIININSYDAYIDDIKDFQVSRFMNKENIVLVPNLTYNPRACFLSKESIADGSVALLTPKEGESISKKDLEYYNSDEFKNFYLLARNLGTRSLNIDNNAVFFFGKLINANL